MLMNTKKKSFRKAFNTKGEYCSTESLFIALIYIFQQQKMIGKLIDKLSNIK